MFGTMANTCTNSPRITSTKWGRLRSFRGEMNIERLKAVQRKTVQDMVNGPYRGPEEAMRQFEAAEQGELFLNLDDQQWYRWTGERWEIFEDK